MFSKIKILFFFLLIFSIDLNAIPNLIQAYVEAPIGMTLYGMEVKNYTLDDAISIAKLEAAGTLSAMIYGYNFFYTVQNKNFDIKESLELTPIAKIDPNSTRIKLTENKRLNTTMKFQVTYTLDSKEQNYIKNFLSNAKFAVGKTDLKRENPYNLLIRNYEKTIQEDRREEYINRVYDYLRSKVRIDDKNFRNNTLEDNSKSNNDSETEEMILTSFDYRRVAYENSIKNAIVVGAKQKTNYRPFILTGKISLKESPDLYMNNGKWESTVKVNIIIDKITYITTP